MNYQRGMVFNLKLSTYSGFNVFHNKDNGLILQMYEVPLKADSRTGAGLGASRMRRAYLLRAPLFSLGTISCLMKRVRSLMS